MKKLLSVLLCVALVLTAASITAFAAAAPIAKVGNVDCYTIAEAVAMVEDGGTIELVAGEITEEINTGRIDKSFTIVGAADYATVVTGGIVIGTDNSSWPVQECTVTVKGITFKTNGLKVMDIRNVIIEDNKFENINDSAPAAIYVADPSTDGLESKITVKNNVVDGAAQGIRIRAGYNVEITGNTVKNTQHNAITLEHDASKWPANAGTVTIADNTFENWALGGEGRVVRAAFGAAEELEKEINFTGNKMVREEEPAEEYAKLTGVGTTAVNLEKNYWNSEAPDFEAIITVEGGNTEVEVTEYYKAETMKAEDLNTYVAPPAADEDENKDENKDESKDETQKDNTAGTTDKKDEVKDDKNTSPKTGDNMIAVAVLAVSAAALVISARKVK